MSSCRGSSNLRHCWKVLVLLFAAYVSILYLVDLGIPRIKNYFLLNHFIGSGMPRLTAAPKPTKTTGVILLAYMRGGSTFAGSLLDNHHGVFYVFEPLTGLSEAFRRHKEFGPVLQYIDGTFRHVSMKDRKKEFERTIDKYLKCELDKLSIDTLRTRHMRFSSSTKEFDSCNGGKYSLIKMRKCVRTLQKKCKNSTMVVLKSIRFNMDSAIWLMKNNSFVKVIHLVRDPRGIILSRNQVSYMRMKNMSQIRQDCDRIAVNHKIGEKYNQVVAEKIKLVYYEELADDPLKYVYEIYSFLGLKVTSRTLDFVQNITNATNSGSKNCLLCVAKNNSHEVATKWRQTINMTTLNTVHKQCRGMFRQLRYVNLTFSEVRNLSIPTLIP